MDREIICGEKEICEYYKITPKELDALRKQGFPALRMGHRLWVHTGVVAGWFEKQMGPAAK
jgi:hypothetical protein